MAKNDKGQLTFDQHVNSNGRARMLAVGKILPSDFGWVRVTRTRHDEDTVWIQIKRLSLVEGGE